MSSSQQETGFGLVETLVAVVILGITILAALRLFNLFISNLTTSRQRDGIATWIASDLAQLRSSLSDWTLNPDDGTYSPPEVACESNTLATAARSDIPSSFPVNAVITDVANTSAALQDVKIMRTITAEGNAFNVSYATAAGTDVEVNTTTTLVPPALAWCP